MQGVSKNETSETFYGLIYSAFCTASGKYYVGQTVRALEQRQKKHFESNGCPVFYNALKKYGKGAFVWTILIRLYSTDDSAIDQKDLNDAEQYWINQFNCISPNGYNLRTKGGRTGKGKLHPSTIAKLIVIRTGKKWTEAQRIKVRNRPKELHPCYGKPKKESTKKKIGDANRGENNGWFGTKGPNFGKKASIKTKALLSAQRMGLHAGSKHPNVKLTEKQAQEILNSDKPGVELAKEFGIRTSQVSRIKSGKRWGHLKKAT